MNIADIKSRPGMSGFDFTGKIERFLGQYRTGDGQYGPYSFQDMMVSDPTGKVLVTVKNHPQIPDTAIGKRLSVKCRSFNGTLRGTIVKQEQDDDNEGNAQTIVKVEITKSATVMVIDEQVTQVSQGSNEATETRTVAEPSDTLNGWIDAYLKAGEVLNTPQVKAVLSASVASGWSSEDLRTLATTIVLSRTRR